MKFLYVTALALGVLVVVPYLAHRLRRRRAEEKPFAPTRLVPPALPRARRRSDLEDRALFASRALAVVALALLGASPFVRCSRLAMHRPNGASIAMAIIVDDSMSMRARDGMTTRFEVGRKAAHQLVTSARDGDAIAIVLAGMPARVVLAATSDLGVAQSTIESLRETDRGTDLDGAVALAQSLLADLPQTQKRIVLLSDLADGHPHGASLRGSEETPLWAPLMSFASDVQDCAVTRADRIGMQVAAHIRCTPGTTPEGRDVVVRREGKEIRRIPSPRFNEGDVQATLSRLEDGQYDVGLLGKDAIATDDSAPVLAEGTRSTLAVVVDPQSEAVATGGAPVLEQALAALHTDYQVRPLPQVPDDPDEFTRFGGLIVDDPPGLTPEQRRAISSYLETGGVVLLALGPRSADPPLGANLEPFLSRGSQWAAHAPPGVDLVQGTSGLAELASSLSDLAPQGRSLLDSTDLPKVQALLRWADGGPFLVSRTIGRGQAWYLTLPIGLNASELALRPGFLGILEQWLAIVREHSAPRRTLAGTPWQLPLNQGASLLGPDGQRRQMTNENLERLAPDQLGLYRLDFEGGHSEVRVVAPDEGELDFRPRTIAPAVQGGELGETQGDTDLSSSVAFLVLLSVSVELGLRYRSLRKVAADGNS